MHTLLGISIKEWLAVFIFGIPAASAYGLASMAIDIASLPFEGRQISLGSYNLFDVWDNAAFFAIVFRALTKNRD